MKNSRTPRLSDLIRQPAPARTGPEAPEPDSAGAQVSAPEPPQAGGAESGEPKQPTEPPPRPLIEPTPAEVEARLDYGLLIEWLERVFESAGRGALECEDLLENVQAILDRPLLLDALFAETFKTRREGVSLAQKSLNVGIYALRLGRAVGYEGKDLLVLGAAALLHKIGLARIPAELLEAEGALGRRDLATLREHPKLARELVSGLGPGFERIAAIVYQAHERCDGSGYPEALREAGICEESRIIGLVDVFEALIQPRPYRERLIPFNAVKVLLQREKPRFPRALLREFIASFSVFPPFTYVRLNSRAVARVEETEPGFPLRPKVTIVLDASGTKPERPQTLRLRSSPLLYITGPVGEEELPVSQPG